MNIASEHTLRYKSEATCFNEALPLGNGRIGAMIYGGVSEEKISLNEDTLWSGYPKKPKGGNYPFVYHKAKSLLDEGKITEAQALLEGNFGDCLVQMYLPLANLKIQTEHFKVRSYSRVLKLDTAVHTVNYVMDDKRYTRECFVSEPHQVMLIRFTCNEKASVSFCATMESRFETQREKAESVNGFLYYGTAPNSVAEYGGAYKKECAHVMDGKGVSYACTLGVKVEGGTVVSRDGMIRVQDADEAVIYFSTRTNFKRYDAFPAGEEYKEICLLDMTGAMCVDYAALKKESIRSHKRLYNRCQISFEKGTMARISTDIRLKRLSEGYEDQGLYVLLFNYGKYLTIAGSRQGTQPLNLQGIWNDKVIAPWSSNYTLNINTEMNYWPTLGMGLFECYEPLVRLVEELAEAGKITAKNYYGVDGWVCHHSSDIWRLTHPGTNRIPGNAPWGFWNMASGWLSVMLWRYYEYTLDQSYLERIYPVIEGAARFYKEMLAKCDGDWILPLSTSPENNYIENGEVHAIDKSTAMTQEILYDLFWAVSAAAKILKMPDCYEKVLLKLKRPSIQDNGELCEWHREHEVWDVHHRHVSHLYGLFPSNQWVGNAEMKQAARKVLEARGGAGTGWSLAWKINLWARLEDGEYAFRLLKNQLRIVSANEEGHDVGGGSYPNLFCAHPPFQIDGNFGAASGIMEMLIQIDEDGNPKLLPALPREWKEGSVKGVCLPGRRKISFSWKDGKIHEVRIKQLYS